MKNKGCDEVSKIELILYVKVEIIFVFGYLFVNSIVIVYWISKYISKYWFLDVNVFRV